MRFLLFALALIIVAGAGFGLSEPRPKGAIVLTVGGAIETANRGPFDKASDTLFAHNEISFDRAIEFDLEMLDGLEQGQALVQPPQRAKPRRFSGPTLAALIEKIGAQGKTLRFTSLDGFAAETKPDEIAAKKWIVATREDDRPLALGGQGPIWLMHAPADGVKPTEAEEDRWPSAVFYIEVLKSE